MSSHPLPGQTILCNYTYKPILNACVIFSVHCILILTHPNFIMQLQQLQVGDMGNAFLTVFFFTSFCNCERAHVKDVKGSRRTVENIMLPVTAFNMFSGKPWRHIHGWSSIG